MSILQPIDFTRAFFQVQSDIEEVDGYLQSEEIAAKNLNASGVPESIILQMLSDDVKDCKQQLFEITNTMHKNIEHIWPSVQKQEEFNQELHRLQAIVRSFEPRIAQLATRYMHGKISKEVYTHTRHQYVLQGQYHKAVELDRFTNRLCDGALFLDAICAERVEDVKKLIEKGVKFFYHDPSTKENAINLAIRLKKRTIIELLFEHMPYFSVMVFNNHTASLLEHNEDLKMLVITCLSRYGYASLLKGDLTSFEACALHGIDLKYQDPETGNTLLHVLVANYSIEQLEAFFSFSRRLHGLFKSSHLSLPNHIGKTPIHLAKELEKQSLIELICIKKPQKKDCVIS